MSVIVFVMLLKMPLKNSETWFLHWGGDGCHFDDGLKTPIHRACTWFNCPKQHDNVLHPALRFSSWLNLFRTMDHPPYRCPLKWSAVSSTNFLVMLSKQNYFDYYTIGLDFYIPAPPYTWPMPSLTLPTLCRSRTDVAELPLQSFLVDVLIF